MRFISIPLFIFICFGISTNAHAKKGTNLIAVGQGVSSPAVTSVVNFTSGLTFENPVGTIYQDGPRLSVQYDENGHSTLGVELGVGGNNWGIAAGYRQPDCDNCEENTAGAVGVGLGSVFALGLRAEEDVNGIGLIFNHQGDFRVGATFDLDDSGGENNNVTRMGAGVALVKTNWTFAVDASKREHENSTANANDDIIFLTPGLMIRADIFQLSVNYQLHLNDDNEIYEDEFWFGLGIGNQTWHLAVYSDYVNDLAVSGSWFF